MPKMKSLENMRGNRTSGNGFDAGCENAIAQDIIDAKEFNAKWTGGQPRYALRGWDEEQYRPDVTLHLKTILPSIISVKLQQTKGTTDQKLAEEIENLLYLSENRVEMVMLVLAGRGWRWQQPVEAVEARMRKFMVGGPHALETGRFMVVHVFTKLKCLWCLQEWTDEQRVKAGKCPDSQNKDKKHAIKVAYVDSRPMLEALRAYVSR